MLREEVLWKILVERISPNRGENKKYLKPPPRYSSNQLVKQPKTSSKTAIPGSAPGATLPQRDPWMGVFCKALKMTPLFNKNKCDL